MCFFCGGLQNHRNGRYLFSFIKYINARGHSLNNKEQNRDPQTLKNIESDKKKKHFRYPTPGGPRRPLRVPGAQDSSGTSIGSDFLQKYRVGIEKNQKTSTKDGINNRQGSSERSPPDPRNPSKIMENYDFLAENKTSLNRSPVAQGHSGDDHGPGKACYDAL